MAFRRADVAYATTRDRGVAPGLPRLAHAESRVVLSCVRRDESRDVRKKIVALPVSRGCATRCLLTCVSSSHILYLLRP